MKVAGESGRCLLTTTQGLAGSVRECWGPDTEAAGDDGAGRVADGVVGSVLAEGVAVGVVSGEALTGVGAGVGGTPVPDADGAGTAAGSQAARAAAVTGTAAAARKPPKRRRLKSPSRPSSPGLWPTRARPCEAACGGLSGQHPS